MPAEADGEHHLVHDEKQNSVSNGLTFSHSGSLLLRLRNPQSAEVLRKPYPQKNASAKPSPLFRAYEVVPNHHARGACD